MLFGSFHAILTYFVWLPLATISSLLFINLIEVYARVLPNLSQVTSALIVSPTLPPELRYVTAFDCYHSIKDRIEVVIPLRSVLTPVAKRPREATAREPPRSTIDAIVPPWRI